MQCGQELNFKKFATNYISETTSNIIAVHNHSDVWMLLNSSMSFLDVFKFFSLIYYTAESLTEVLSWCFAVGPTNEL